MHCDHILRHLLATSHAGVKALGDDVGQAIVDDDLPGLRLHPLRGERRGQWAVSVSGNWRVVFEFDGPDATEVDLVDYH